MICAVVTGASSGLGTELARGIKNCFPEIERVYLLSRRKERLESLAGELDIDAVPVAIDLTDRQSVIAFSGELKKQDHFVKLLINSAGFGKLGDFDESDLNEQLGMIETNVTALTCLTRLMLGLMGEGSKIINISSIASFVPNARMTVYSASKYYVRAFSRALGFELKKKKITVTAVCPGPMATEFMKTANIDHNSKAFETLPYNDAKKVAQGALKAAKNGKSVYTPGFIYKLYRVLSTIVPDTIFMHLAKT